MVGSVKQYPTETTVRKSATVQALLLSANAQNPCTTATLFGAVVGRYELYELPERYSTRRSYQSYLDNHIKPRWQSVPLAEIKPVAVEDWANGLKLAGKSKAHVRGLMHVLFECACRWELVERNPISLVRLKGSTKRLKRPVVLEPAEFRALVSNLAEPFRTMTLVAGCLGLRVSEIVGLQWRDFDFTNRTLLIQRGVVHGRIGAVKTSTSHAAVPIDPSLLEVLWEHRKRCYPTEEQWLFANPRTERPFHQEQIVKTHLTKASAAAGIKVKVGWHTFRHSYRSWLDQAGASLGIQRELMRHASITTTMDTYGRAMDEGKRAANSNVVQLIMKHKQEAADQQKAS